MRLVADNLCVVGCISISEILCRQPQQVRLSTTVSVQLVSDSLGEAGCQQSY